MLTAPRSGWYLSMGAQYNNEFMSTSGVLAKYLRMDPYKDIMVDITARFQFDQASVVEVGVDPRVAEWDHVQQQQVWLQKEILRHPVTIKFPPRSAFRVALLKAILGLLEDIGARISSQPAAAASIEGDEEAGEVLPWDEEGVVADDLLDLYLSWRSEESSSSSRGEALGKDEDSRFYTSYALAPSASTDFVSFSVTSHFVNVGFALWPSSFVLVDLLATLLGTTPGEGSNSLDELHRHLSLPSDRPPTIVELGAGVGLTPVILDKVAGNPPRCFVTDYQPAILENCAENCARNDTPCTLIKAETDPGVVRTCANGLAMLDWMETTEKYDTLRTIAPDILVAADCVYDHTVLDGLNDTLRYTLTGRKGGELMDEAPEAPLCDAAVIVQTHRNDETQKKLHAMINEYADVTSYRYVPRESEEGGWALRALGVPWLQSVDTPIGKPAQALGGEYPLRSTGNYKVEMHDLLFVHIVRGRPTNTSSSS